MHNSFHCPSYVKLDVAASELLAKYQQEQRLCDSRRVLGLFLAETKNVAHEQWIGFIVHIAESLRPLHQGTQNDKNFSQSGRMLFQSFCFVFHQLMAMGEESSILGICCSNALEASINDLRVFALNNTYHVLMPYIRTFCFKHNAPRFHQAMDNVALLEKIQSCAIIVDVEKDGFILV
jgi:hypothetical protein